MAIEQDPVPVSAYATALGIILIWLVLMAALMDRIVRWITPWL